MKFKVIKSGLVIGKAKDCILNTLSKSEKISLFTSFMTNDKEDLLYLLKIYSFATNHIALERLNGFLTTNLNKFKHERKDVAKCLVNT